MDTIERLSAIEELKQLKARYFRGVDCCDGDLVRGVLAKDCVLDYVGCFTDPASGKDFIPAMNVVLRGRDAWLSDGLSRFGIVSVHQGYNFDVEFDSDTTAKGIWSMTDRLYFPPGGELVSATGYGYYFDTYEKIDGVWLLKTTRIKRIRVEVS